MKNSELYNLRAGLLSVGSLTGIKFAYAVARNKAKLDSEISTMESVIKPKADFLAYEEERISLAKESAVKDSSGKPTVDGGNYVMANQEVFDKAIKTLQEKHKAAIEGREKQLSEYKNFLDEESSFKPYMVKMEFVPEAISPNQLSGIFPMIDDKEYTK